MLSWLIGFAIFIVFWGLLWTRNLVLSFGILVGLLLAWLVSKPITPYLTGMEEIPLWLPPLPFAIVAVTLLVYGALIWFRGAPPLRQDSAADEHHH
jgi:hypothetical protein